MTYDMHIDNSEKSLCEWWGFVSEHSEFEFQNKATVSNPETGEVIIIQASNSAVAKNGLYFRASTNEDNLVITVSTHVLKI